MKPVLVKPLIWTPASPVLGWRRWAVDHSGKWLFTLDETVEGHYLLRRQLEPAGIRESFPTLAAAQAAATVEWEIFIRAAVEETP